MKKIYAALTRIAYTLTLPLTGMFLHNSKRVRVLVTYKEEVLLQRTCIGSQKWSVPGGGVEKNENPITAAIRETAEEVGVAIPEAQIKCLGEQRRSARRGNWPMVDVVFYEAKLDSKQKPRISRPLEILEARWFKITDLPDNCSDTLIAALELEGSR